MVQVLWVVPGVRTSDSEGTIASSQISALALHSGVALGKLQNCFGSLFLIYKMGVTAIVLWRKCDNV